MNEWDPFILWLIPVAVALAAAAFILGGVGLVRGIERLFKRKAEK